MSELRSAVDWLKVLDQAEDWLETFKADKDAKVHPFISFEDIGSKSQLDGIGDGSAWNGDLIVPRALAVEMMAWLADRARAELKKLGVKG